MDEWKWCVEDGKCYNNNNNESYEYVQIFLAAASVKKELRGKSKQCFQADARNGIIINETSE